MSGVTASAAARQGNPPIATPRLYWWKEFFYCGAFYTIYTTIRNTQGSARVGAAEAFHNARRVVRVEKALHIFWEKTVQGWFLGARSFVKFWNVYYGSAHFIVTLGAMVWCFKAMPRRYTRMRNTLACMTGLALIGFALFPLMPPRLLPESYGFVDTLKVVGGLWNFDSGPVAKVSNQFAAMPSLHFGWSAWCVMVFWPAAHRTWQKVMLVIYPAATTFGIVVTANHYILDALGGAVVLIIGVLMGSAIAIFWERRLPSPE